MKISQYNRRNFLSSLAILSAGSAFGSTLKHFSPPDLASDLQKEWKNFWKNSGGDVYYSLTDFNAGDNRKDTKGHTYKYGEIIYFPKENILAQPTWIFWSDQTKPADVIVTLFEKNNTSAPVIRFNRYEMDVLYRLSKEPGREELFQAFLNNRKGATDDSMEVIKAKTNIKKKSLVQEITYHKGQSLIPHKKSTIYNA